MNPIKIDLIDARRRIIQREIDLLAALQKAKISKKSPLAEQHALCHSVLILLSAVIDISQHLVAEKSSRVPESYSQAIELLGELQVLDAEFANKFSTAAKLRNVVVHAYGDVNIDLLASYVPRLVTDSKKFLKQIEKSLGLQ